MAGPYENSSNEPTPSPVVNPQPAGKPVLTADSFRAIVGSLSQLVSYVDRDLVYRFVNERYEQIFGVRSADVLGKRLPEFIGPDAWAKARPHVEKVLAGHRERYVEIYDYPGGQTRHIRGELIPDRDSTGTVAGYWAVLEDITDHQLLIEDLLEQQRIKSILLDSTAEMFAYYNLDLEIQWCNRAAEKSVEAEPGGLNGKHCFEIWQGRDEPCPGCPVLEALRTRTQTEADLTTPDGRRWHLRGYPVFDDLGELVGLAEFGQDITDRDRAEQALKRNEARLREAMQIARMGSWEYDLTSGRVDWSPEVYELTGVPLPPDPDAPSPSLEDFFGMVHPDDRQRFENHAEEFMGGKANLDIEYRLVRADGEVRHMHTRGRFSPGRPDHMVGLVHDITERVQMEQALRKSEAYARALLDANPEMMFRYGCDGKILDFKSARDFEPFLPPEQFLHRRVQDLLPEAEGRELLAAIQRVCLTGQVETLTYAYPAQGKTRHFEGVLAPVQDAEVLMCVRDITDRKHEEKRKLQLTEQMQHAQKLESLGVLAGGIAHDFNNILVGILGNADLLESDLAGDEDKLELVRELRQAAQRAAELAGQMLAYSGKGRFQIHSVNLNELIQDMSSLLRSILPKQASLTMDLSEDLPAIQADPAQLNQVVMNVLVNACESLPPTGGAVTLTTGCENLREGQVRDEFLQQTLPAGPYVRMEVTDTGCGMDEATRTKIFEPFFSTKFTGRGLGLAAVLGIIRGHRGGIVVDSLPGKGTNVVVFFPLENNASRKNETSAGQAVTPTKHSGTLLMVDDESSVLTVGGRMLKRLGYTVLTATCGTDALDLLRRNAQDIRAIIIDLTMPLDEGQHPAEALRRFDPDLPLFLSSGYARETAIDALAHLNPSGFIQKPYCLEALAEKLAGLGD